MSDVVALLTGGIDCEFPIVQKAKSTPQPQVECELPNLDVVVVFDNADGTLNLSDPSVNSNKFLLLDVLGKLFCFIAHYPATV